MILVVTHKSFDFERLPDGYKVIKVGNNITDEEAARLGYLTDATGDNITEKNRYYCELTAQYWVWKNLERTDDFIGIAHYRRYFFDYRSPDSSGDFWGDILSDDSIRDILNKKKAIIPFPAVKYKPIEGDSYNNLSTVVLREIIEKYYPEYKKEFERAFLGRTIYWCNMFVTRWEIFDAYNKWLFDILKKYDVLIEKRGVVRPPRIDGFLAESLFYAWFRKNFKKSDLYCMEIRNIETDNFRDYERDFLGKLMRIGRRLRPVLVSARAIRYVLLRIFRGRK